MTPFVDHYRVLHVASTAGKAEITASYRRLSKLYHPDINPAPGAEAVMKTLNAAYHILRDDARRSEYDIKYSLLLGKAGRGAPASGGQDTGRGKAAEERAASQRSPQAANKVMEDYLGHLLSGEAEKAYQLLCLHDRQYVTLQSFCQWRQSAGKLFAMRDFNIAGGEDIENFRLDEGTFAPARKMQINITEKNHASGALEKYQIVKHTVLEYGRWRVFLGYRDLNEIARMFEDMSRRQEEGEMARWWEDYCRSNCRGLDMLSRQGFIQRADREIYSFQRHGQSMTVAVFDVRPAGSRLPEEALGHIVESCAQALTASLRRTDIPAYLGGGVFGVLFIEMKKRHAASVLKKFASLMRDSVQRDGGRVISPEYAHRQYEGGKLEDYLDQLSAETAARKV